MIYKIEYFKNEKKIILRYYSAKLAMKRLSDLKRLGIDAKLIKER